MDIKPTEAEIYLAVIMQQVIELIDAGNAPLARAIASTALLLTKHATSIRTSHRNSSH
jgi:hypothetical protein